MRNFGAALARGAAGVGRSAGQSIGRDIGTGIEQARGMVEKATTAMAKATDKVADAAGRARVAQAAYQKLIDEGVTDTVKLTRAKEALESAQRREVAATRDAETATRNLSQAESRAASATDEVASSTDRASGGLKSMFSGLGGGIKQLGAFTAGAAGVGGAVALMGKSMEQGKIGSKLAASFGESAEEAKRYGQVAGDLYASGVGSSMDDIREAVSAVGGSFGSLDTMGGARLEQLSAKASGFADIFDMDVSGSVQAASQLMTNGFAGSADEAFDLLTRGMQEVSVEMRGELPEILNEYGTNFRALGFDGKDAFNLLISASQGGAIALDKTGDALKEFTILASSGDKSVGEAFAAIGADADLMASDIAVGGENAQYALQQTAQKLLEVEDPAKRAQLAIGLFGAPLEDLSVDQIPGFLTALAGTDDAIGSFEGALDGSIGVLNDNSASAFDTFKRGLEQNVTNMLGENVLPMLGNFSGALEENEGSLLGAVAGMTGMTGAVAGFETAKGTFDSVKEGAIGLKDGFMSAKDTAVGMADNVKKGVTAVKDFDVASKLSSATTKIWTGIQAAFNLVMSLNPIGLIVIAVGLLVAAVVLIATKTTWFQTIWDAVWNGVTAAWDWAWGKLQQGWELLKQAFTAIGDKVTEVKDWIVGKWNELVAFVTELPGKIGAAASGMWQSIQDAAGVAKDWVVDKWNGLVGFVTELPGKIASAASGMWDGIKNSAKSVFNTVAGWWNNSLGSITWTVPSWVPGVGGKSIGFPKMPTLATGGIAGRREDGRLWGPGTGTSDSILGIDTSGMPTALVSTDEGVVKKTAMDNGGAQLVAALNAGWVPSVDFLRGMLPAFAGGGLVSADQMNKFPRENGLEGAEYDWGGVNWGDCSGAMSALANYASGRDPFGSRFATGNMAEELAARGAIPGIGPSGSMNFGWFNGGPYGGHTAGELPDGTFVEMGGARGDGQVGGGAADPRDPMFTDHAHFPPEFFLGGDPEPTGTMTADAPAFDDTLSPGTSGGSAPIGSTTSTAGTSTVGTSSSGSSSSSGSPSAMSLSDFAGQTASDFAKETTKDTLDFFGLGAWADLPLIPNSQVSKDIAPVQSGAPAPDDANSDLPAESNRGPLINIEKLITEDADGVRKALHTEATRLLRSDALVGGWLG